MNKISENYYERRAEMELDKTVFKDLLKIATTTRLFEVGIPEEYVTDSVIGTMDGDEYNIYCNKLRIHFVDNENLFGVEIFICTNHWNDSSNEEFKVYSKCVERMFTGNVRDDSIYIAGSWNRYVLSTFKKIKKGIESRQESAQFDEFYKNEA